MNIKLSGVVHHSSVNGPGVRYVIFTQGCNHHCKGCQNPITWDSNGGYEMDIDVLINDVLETKYIDGVTLSGGDPLCQLDEIYYLCMKLKDAGINIWCYTGYTYKQIESSDMNKILDVIDVLIDGRFDEKKKNSTLLYRGSSNQKIIDAKESRLQGKCVEIAEKDVRV